MKLAFRVVLTGTVTAILATDPVQGQQSDSNEADVAKKQQSTLPPREPQTSSASDQSAIVKINEEIEKTKAEIDKTKAEADKARAEADKLRAESANISQLGPRGYSIATIFAAFS